MKKIIGLFAAILFMSGMQAQPPAGKANKGDFYGEKPDKKGAAHVSDLPHLLEKNDTAAVKLIGRVLDVCSAKGCWMTMRVNDSTEAFVKMKDYAFFVPEKLKGKTVVLEGIAFVKTTSVEELKHYAEDAGKSAEEIATITEPEKQIRLMASGILVVE